MVFTKLTHVLLHTLVMRIAITASVGPPLAWAVVDGNELAPLGLEGQPPRRSLKTTVRIVDPEATLPSGAEVGLEYEKFTPLPGVEDAYVALASWTGRRLSPIPGVALDPSWPAAEDGTTFGCVIACFKGGKMQRSLINIGSGSESAACKAGDLFAALSTRNPGSWDIYVSGSFKGKVLHRSGGAQPSACVNSSQGCGFIGLISVTPAFQTSLQNFDFIRAANPWVANPDSHIGRLSPSVFGVWLSGTVTRGSGTFGGEVNAVGAGNFTLTSGSQPRGFVGHFANKDFGFGLSWAQSLSDGRLNSDSPQISNVADSPDCTVVFADEYKAGAPLFQTSLTPEYIKVPKFNADTGGRPSAIIVGSFQLRAAAGQANVCRNPFAVGAKALLTGWKIADGGKVNVISSRFRAGSVKSAFAFAAITPSESFPSIEAGIYKSEIFRNAQTKRIKGVASPADPFIFADQGINVTAVQGLSYNPYSNAWIFALQRTPQICTLAAFDSLQQSAVFADIDRRTTCSCTLRRFATKSFMSPDTGDPLTQVSITGSFGSGCAPQPSGSFGFSYPPFSSDIIDPETAVRDLIQIATSGAPITKRDLSVAGSRLAMFPEDFKIVEASFKVVDKAVGDAIETGDGLDFPSRTDRVTSVLSAASATPQYKSKASTTIALLPEAVVLGANSTSAVAARAVVLEAVADEFGASTEVLRSTVSAAESLLDTATASNGAIGLNNQALDSLMPVLHKAGLVQGTDATDLRNQAVSLQVQLPAKRVANANTGEQVEETALKLQEWLNTASECPLNTCGESELAAASVLAIDDMLDKVAASPDLMSPTAAQAMLDVLLKGQADTDGAVVASVARKLSQAVVKNSAPTSEGLEETLATLSLMTENLQGNPAAIDGLADSLAELHKSAIATPGIPLTEAGFNDARKIAETVVQSTDSPSSIEAIEKVPSLVVMNIINSKGNLDSGTSRLASLIPVFQGSSRMTPLLQETKALLKIIPSRDDLDVSPESFSAITDIIIAGKQSPSGSQPFKAANAVAQELATATTSEAGFKDNIAIDAMLLLNNLDLYYGSQGEERVLNSTLDGVEDILEAAETSKSCRADTDATIPLAKILLVSLKGDHFSDELQETAIGLAERLPSATTESTITPESLEDAPRALQYLAQEFSGYNGVVSNSVEEVDKIVSAVVADESLLLTEEGLQNILSVLSVGIQTDANAELAWSVVDKLPYVLKKSLSPGETMRAGAEDLQMTIMWSTAQDPFLEGITVHNVSDTEYKVKSKVLLPSDVMTAASHYVVLRHSTAETPSRSDLDLDQGRVKAFEQASTGTFSVALLDPSTMEPVHARRLQQVSQAAQKDLTWTFYERNSSASNPGRTDDSNAVEIPQCLRVDSETGLGSAKDCVPMPRFLPGGFHSLPNPNYKFPPPPDSLEPFWIIRPNNPENEIDCRTVRNLKPYPVMRKSQELFGDVKFEGTECWFYEETWDDPDADNIYPERGQNCLWDDLAQIFFGPDCGYSPDEDLNFLGCMCFKTTGDSWYQRTTVDNSIEKDYVDDRTHEYVADDWSLELSAMLECVFAPILGVISLAACILLFAWLWDPRRKSALLRKFFEAKNSCQCESALVAGRKDPKVQFWKLGRRTANFNLDDHRDEVWRWSLETHVFKVLADDMEHYITLPPAQQATQNFFDSAVVRLCALVGLPMHRVMACIPSSDNLSWYPLNGKSIDIIFWRNQALGTSLAMGFFLNNSLISDQVAEEQIEKQDAYFAGCHPMGMRALIRRWRVMLSRRNVQDYGNGWHAKCRVWKIIWLQRHDGLWDLTEDFLTAVGADPELLLGVNCAKVPAQDGKECVENQVPAVLEVLFYGESELRLQLWCTFLAKAFLELATDTFAEFSGREPDASSHIPTLPTVIAKDAILYAINQKHMDQALIADLSEVYCEGTDELVASVENDALQLVRSLNILREERQKAWASEELEFITRETSKERQKRKHKEGKTADFSRKDFAVVLNDFLTKKFKRSLSIMISHGEEIAPSGVVKTWNFISGVFGTIFHAMFHWNGTIRVGFSAITDALIVQERTLVVCTTWLFMLAFLTYMFDTGGAQCCDITKEYYRCGTSEYGPEYCVRYRVDQFKSPAGLRYYSNTTELISPELSCIALRATYPPLDNSFRVGPGEEQPTTPDNCEAFPRWNSTVDIMLVSFIVAAMALPFKIILKKVFNLRRRLSFSSLWVTNSGIQAIINVALGRGSGWQAGARALLRAEIQPVENYHVMVAKPKVVIDDQKAKSSPAKSRRESASSNNSRVDAKSVKSKAKQSEQMTRSLREITTSTIGEITPASETSHQSHQSSENMSRASTTSITGTAALRQNSFGRAKTLPSHHAKVLKKRSSRLQPPMLQQHASYI